MDDSKIISGVIVPTLTFFEEDGAIGKKANEALILHLIENSVNVIFVLGSTGEGLYFKSKPQKKREYLQWLKGALLKHEISQMIVVGVYGEKPSDVISDSQMVLEILPNAGLVVPPPVERKLSEREQIKFFTQIARSLNAPIYLYNNPGRFGGTKISVGALKQLKPLPNIRGIKDSSSTLQQKRDYLMFLDENFTVTCGKEGMMADFIAEIPNKLREYSGIVPSIGNIVNICADIFQFGLGGKDEEMKKLQEELNSFRNKIYDSSDPNGKAQRGVKRALSFLYSKKFGIDFPLFVSPPFQKDVSSEIIDTMQKTVRKVVDKGYIRELRTNISKN